ncbi:MOSC domain-containing protein [Candidatus Woesebacteria bacterium]|nr:MOSC domain-containing protein [Candidatus Woesebacteria bacterium]
MNIKQLFIYPVKSFAAITQSSMAVEPTGLVGDRRFVVVDPEGNFLSQRKFPKMATIDVEFCGDVIYLSIGDMEISVPSVPTGALVDIKIHSDTCKGIDCGDEIARRLSEVIGTPCRLVFQDPTIPRVRHASAVGSEIEVSFADGYPILLLGMKSVDDLNQKLQQGGHPTVLPNVFRPNILFDGDDTTAFTEDGFGRIQIGEVILRAVKKCSRCTIVNVDQRTGVPCVGGWPLKTLAKYRREDKGVFMGMNCIVEKSGIIRLSDEIVLL